MTVYPETIEPFLNKGIQLKKMRLRTSMNTSKCLFPPIWNIPADFPNGFVI